MSQLTNPKTDAVDKPTPWSKLGISATTISAVPDLLDILWAHEKKITVCLIGETGIGKSPIVKQWVDSRGGYLRVLNFGHMNPEDISMAMFSEKGDSYGNVPPDWLLELNACAERQGCAVLFFDEWNRGEKALVNALFTLTDERRVHNFMLHPNVLVVAAMNPSDGAYLVNAAERDHAIRKRLNFVFTQHDLAGWLRFARQDGFDRLVIEYVQAQPSHFYDTAARDAGKVFSCPANWEKVSNILKAARKLGKNLATDTSVATLVKGQIGHAIGDLFLQFVANEETVIKASDVLLEYPKHRKRIAKLLGQEIVNGRMQPIVGEVVEVRADVVANLNQNLAMIMFTDRPDPQTIAKNLSAYMTDLSPELFIQFLSEHIGGYAKQSTDNRKYIDEVNAELKQIPAYLERARQVAREQQQLAQMLGMFDRVA